MVLRNKGLFVLSFKFLFLLALSQDIQLRGLGIANEHCIVELVDRQVFLTPVEKATSVSPPYTFILFNALFSSRRTRVNGRVVTEKTKLRHGSRILLGNNHLFRLSCPKLAGVLRVWGLFFN